MEVYYLGAAARQPDCSDSFAEPNDCFFERQGRTPAHGRTTTVDPAGRDRLGVPHCRMANRFPGLICAWSTSEFRVAGKLEPVVLRAQRFRGFALNPFPGNARRAVSARSAFSPFLAGGFMLAGLPAPGPALQVHSVNAPDTSQRRRRGVGACDIAVRADSLPDSSAGDCRTRRTVRAEISHHRQEACHGHFRHP
jgi:hypothetical protein